MHNYTERQNEWLEVTGIKPGDRVKVIAEAKSHANGWKCDWNSKGLMEVGAVGTVVSEDLFAGGLWPPHANGIPVLHDDPSRRNLGGAFFYPFWVLVKIEDEDD